MKRPRSRTITCASCAALAALVLALGSRAVMHSWWLADLLANLAAQQALVAAVCTLLWLALQRWSFAILGAVVLGAHMWVLGGGRAQHVSASNNTSPTVFRVVQFNGSASLGTTQLRTLIDDAAASAGGKAPDLLAITEPSNHLAGLWSGTEPGDQPSPGSADDPLKGGYPLRQRRYTYDTLGVLSSSGIMLGKHHWTPTPEVLEGDQRRAIAREFLTTIIELDEADQFGQRARVCVIAAHPRSPRSPRRWRVGRTVVETLVLLVRGVREREPGLPIVVIADLNSTPSGSLDSLLTRGLDQGGAGLLRAKPLTVVAGTYPADLPWPLTIAIDDAFVTPGVTINGWQPLGSYGSDHRAVLIECALPAVAAGPSERAPN